MAAVRQEITASEALVIWQRTLLQAAAQCRVAQKYVLSGWNAPARSITRRCCREVFTIRGVRVYYGEPGYPADTQESRLSLRALKYLENDGGLWAARLSRELRSIVLTHYIEYFGCWFADRSCYLSARTALLFKDEETAEVFLAASLIYAVAYMYLLRDQKKGPIGALNAGHLASRSANRFLNRVAHRRQNACLDVLARELFPAK